MQSIYRRVLNRMLKRSLLLTHMPVEEDTILLQYGCIHHVLI